MGMHTIIGHLTPVQNYFSDENFLLQTLIAQQLHHEFAKSLPLMDYRCHLSADQVAVDLNFKNLTQAWLHGNLYNTIFVAVTTVGALTGSGNYNL